MARTLTFLAALPIVLGLNAPGRLRGTTTVVPERVTIEELWHEPGDIAAEDLFHGPWGQAFAPDPAAAYASGDPSAAGPIPE